MTNMAKATDLEIVRFFEKSQGELTQERNDFLLPQIVDFIKAKAWVNIRPEYQRRQVWDQKKKSKLIESLLMNVPIPPIFLYERDYNRYEVMDGQQRLNAIIEFYDNRFKLNRLESWDILNGRAYSELPPKVQRGLDRRRISATVIVSDLSDAPYGPDDIRRQVFDRLNTGGLTLNPQELRNCLYPGLFNKVLISASSNRMFTDVFGIPAHSEHITEMGHVSKDLADNALYKRMRDCELVLRFFTFRRSKGLKSSIPKALDNCMKEYSDISGDKANELENLFLSRLEVALAIFEDKTFHLPTGSKTNKPSTPLFDAVMVAIDRLYLHREALIACRDKIRNSINKELQKQDVYEVIIGKPGTAKATSDRINLIRDTMAKASGVPI